MGTAVERLARCAALMGGVVMVALVAVTCLSVLGRGVNSIGHSSWLTTLAPGVAERLIASGVGPVSGDFELVEAGIAFAIFAFLPICQLSAGHATVDVFTSRLSARANAGLRAFWEGVLTLVIWLITWRLGAGLLDKMSNGETTFLLQFPVWWAYAASFGAAMVASVTAFYAAAGRILFAVTGKRVLPLPETEAR